MAAPLSFAAMAERKTEDLPLRVVQLDAHVVLKIVKHCKEGFPTLVTGQLLGLDVGQTLEVTDCFPFPSRNDEEDGEGDGASYQLDMMRCLREVNVDNNTVGWYQSTVLGSYQTIELIETFVNYAESIKRCVCIVYDPQTSARGTLTLKAITLKDNFIKVYKEGALTGEKMREAAISWKDVFDEIPINVHSSPLATALLHSIEPDTVADSRDSARLDLSVGPLLEKNLEFLNDCMDDIVAEQQKVSFYHRNVARQQQQQQQWLQKRRQENAQRRLAGEEPLPEEDPALFKPIPEPSPLDVYLINNQVDNYCQSINHFGAQTLEKLHMLDGLHKARVSV